jgi:cytochrome P450
MLSIFWAAQANTLPMTFWTLGEIIGNPRIRAKAEAEARRGAWASMPDQNGHYDASPDTIPYIRACLKEVLRMKVAILTHRKVDRDCHITTSTGEKLRLPKDDMVSIASYLRHFDPAIYPDPHTFYPERWLEPEMLERSPLDSMGDDCWFPFSKGRYSCSGKFLALLEIPTLVAMFLQQFDASLVDPLPSGKWDEVLAAVLPDGKCRVEWKRRTGQ